MKVIWLSKEVLSQYQRKALCDIHGEEEIEHMADDFADTEAVASFIKQVDGLVYLGEEWPLKEVVDKTKSRLGAFQFTLQADKQPLAVYHVDPINVTVVWMSGLCAKEGQKVIIPLPKERSRTDN